MSDNTEYWQHYVFAGGDLVFITPEDSGPEDSGRSAVFLSRKESPDITSDRDRALLRAFLLLALRRLDEQENPLRSMRLDHESGVQS
jgi:hypothetical protein